MEWWSFQPYLRVQLGCGVQYKHLCFAFMGASVVAVVFFPRPQHRSTPNYFHFKEYFTHSLAFSATSLGGMPCFSVAFLCVCVCVCIVQLDPKIIHYFCQSPNGSYNLCVCVFLKSIAWSGITTAAMFIHSLNAKQMERCREKNASNNEKWKEKPNMYTSIKKTSGINMMGGKRRRTQMHSANIAAFERAQRDHPLGFRCMRSDPTMVPMVRQERVESMQRNELVYAFDAEMFSVCNTKTLLNNVTNSWLFACFLSVSFHSFGIFTKWISAFVYMAQHGPLYSSPDLFSSRGICFYFSRFFPKTHTHTHAHISTRHCTHSSTSKQKLL